MLVVVLSTGPKALRRGPQLGPTFRLLAGSSGSRRSLVSRGSKASRFFSSSRELARQQRGEGGSSLRKRPQNVYRMTRSSAEEECVLRRPLRRGLVFPSIALENSKVCRSVAGLVQISTN